MWLTKNEKLVLNALIENSRISDTTLAKRLNLSSQAIANIRKRLEEELILGYEIKLDWKALGINYIVLLDVYSKKELTKDSFNCPSIVRVYKLINKTNKYKVVKFVRNLEECETCKKNKCENYEVLESHVIPFENILKEDIKSAIHQAIDKLGAKSCLKEIEEETLEKNIAKIKEEAEYDKTDSN